MDLLLRNIYSNTIYLISRWRINKMICCIHAQRGISCRVMPPQWSLQCTTLLYLQQTASLTDSDFGGIQARKGCVVGWSVLSKPIKAKDHKYLAVVRLVTCRNALLIEYCVVPVSSAIYPL